ncbi:MAG: hypothetical protein RLZZ511_1093 [Cyanobacteriota bacterium]
MMQRIRIGQGWRRWQWPRRRRGTSHQKRRLNQRKAFWLGLLTLASLFYVGVVEPRWIEVRQIAITLPQLDSAFEGYRIVQLTDIHADRWMDADRLGHIVQLTNRQNPDLVVMTGDYVTRSATEFTPTLQALAQLSAPDGTLAVMGNHDMYEHSAMIADQLTQAKVQVLENQTVNLSRQAAPLTIAGLGDALTFHDDLPAVLSQLPAQGPAILLAHEPDVADQTAASDRFGLQLSGHSHGGQIKLPMIGVRRITPKLAKKYPNGLYQVGNLMQYTSRGVGLAGRVRIRLNCRPEITVFTLHTPATAT